MRKPFELCAASLATLALTTIPAMAQQAEPGQASGDAALNHFLTAVETVRSNLPSSPSDVMRAGSQCSNDIDALVRALPESIISDVRCDVSDTGGIDVIGGASLR